MATTNMRIVIRRDTSANWDKNGTVVLLLGEQGYETDTGKMKVGDGTTQYKDLEYFVGGITDVDGTTIVKDAHGAIGLNTDSVIGNINGTVKDYVDHGDSVLAGVITKEVQDRKDADSVLAGVIAEEVQDRKDADSVLGLEIDSLSARIDEIVEVDDGAADSIALLDSQVGFHRTEINYLREIAIKHEDSIIGLDSELTTTNQQVLNNYTELKALDAAQQVQIDALAADSVTLSNLTDSVTALESADAALAADLADSVSALDALKADIDSPEFEGAPVARVYYDPNITAKSRIITLADLDYSIGLIDAAKADKTYVDSVAAEKADLTGATFTGEVTAPEFRGNLANGLGQLVVNTTTSEITAVSVATSAQISADTTLTVGEGATIGENLLVGDAVKATADTVEGNGIFRSSLEVGHRISARSAQLNDNPAGPTDGTLIPFIATAEADVTTKKYVDDADAAILAGTSIPGPYADDAAAAAAGVAIGAIYKADAGTINWRVS